MTRYVVLDAGPLGLVTNPRGSEHSLRCQAWLRRVTRTARIVVPEIADYEVRRELRRARRDASVQRLDNLKAVALYLPITTPAMLVAADLWAEARQRGQPTADPKALDGDVILAAQASLLGEPGDDVIIATDNVGHLGRFVRAELWETINLA